MRVIFTCGGTGGHINPAIAVAKLLQSRQPDCEILFIGAVGGMEETLVRREGFCLETLKISNFQRRLTPAAIGHNVKTAANIAGAMRQVKKILRKFRPDVIVGTGGYASFPGSQAGREAAYSHGGARVQRCPGTDDPDGRRPGRPDHGLLRGEQGVLRQRRPGAGRRDAGAGGILSTASGATPGRPWGWMNGPWSSPAGAAWVPGR